jgi:hypothetical protein
MIHGLIHDYLNKYIKIYLYYDTLITFVNQ